jgi:hypothetical protein
MLNPRSMGTQDEHAEPKIYGHLRSQVPVDLGFSVLVSGARRSWVQRAHLRCPYILGSACSSQVPVDLGFSVLVLSPRSMGTQDEHTEPKIYGHLR